MLKRKFVIGFVLFTVLFCGSCANKHNKLLKSNDHDKKYEAAVAAFEKKDYFHASQLFENLLLYYRGRQKAESVSFYYAQSLLGMKDYYSAGYQFESFYKRFPFSENAEEALYQSAYCKYYQSPEYTLDQTITKEAVKDFQTFVDKYPSSARVPQVNKIMDSLREKLMMKDYEIAFLYYKTGNYQAAQVIFKLFLNNYPDSKYRQDAVYYTILAGYELATSSVEHKQKARYENVIADCQKYAPLFAEKDKTKSEKLLNIYNISKKELEQIK